MTTNHSSVFQIVFWPIVVRAVNVTAANDHCSAAANQQPASQLDYSQRNMDEIMIQVNGYVTLY